MELSMVVLAWILVFFILGVALVSLAVIFRTFVVAAAGQVSFLFTSIWTRLPAVRGSSDDASIVTWSNQNSAEFEEPKTGVTSSLNRQSVEGDSLLERIKQSAFKLLPNMPTFMLTSPSGNDLPLPAITPPNTENLIIDESRIPQPILLNLYWLPRLLSDFGRLLSGSQLSDDTAYDAVEPGSPITVDVEHQDSAMSALDLVAASIGASFMSSDSSSSIFTPAGSVLPTLVSQWTVPVPVQPIWLASEATLPAPVTTSRATVLNSDYQSALQTGRRWSWPLSPPEQERRTAVIGAEYQASLRTSRRMSLPVPKKAPEYRYGRSFSMPAENYSPTVDWETRKTLNERKKDLLVALGLDLPTPGATDPHSVLSPSASSPASFTGSETDNAPPVLSSDEHIKDVDDVPTLTNGFSDAAVSALTTNDDKSVCASSSSGTSSGFVTSGSSVASSSSVTSFSSDEESTNNTLERLLTPFALPVAPVEKLKPRQLIKIEKGKKPAAMSNAKVWAPSATWNVRLSPVQKDMKKPVAPVATPSKNTKPMKDLEALKAVNEVRTATPAKIEKASKVQELKPTQPRNSILSKRADAVKIVTTSKIPVVQRKNGGVFEKTNTRAKMHAVAWR
ncbi:hypothetical protein NEOLEDRAFT_1166492 [Neolentinus lepideus HHB14362 ss-1]|uniref:Uncharacterized protein n=1 Tax=Neolentinus lepideus HHB14362 ss-1 TaxID=1314782 RepID=A0A165VWC0_9AGAM|nr:hypothetical protein NEOLEDRAFT_1166492 [Neolentinus lepideus HHB14362 ss-1]